MKTLAAIILAAFAIVTLVCIIRKSSKTDTTANAGGSHTSADKPENKSEKEQNLKL